MRARAILVPVYTVEDLRARRHTRARLTREKIFASKTICARL